MSVVGLSTRSKQQMAPMQNSLCHQSVLMAENTTGTLTLVCEHVPKEFSGISVCKQKLIRQNLRSRYTQKGVSVYLFKLKFKDQLTYFVSSVGFAESKHATHLFNHVDHSEL